jgi:hypothetical protein
MVDHLIQGRRSFLTSRAEDLIKRADHSIRAAEASTASSGF